jgi:hypothetical protein
MTENLTTSGTGINLKAGLIFKPVERIRSCLTIHTPTWFTLTDKFKCIGDDQYRKLFAYATA